MDENLSLLGRLTRLGTTLSKSTRDLQSAGSVAPSKHVTHMVHGHAFRIYYMIASIERAPCITETP